MSDDIAVKVTNLSKSFNLPHEKQSSLKGLFLSLFKRKSGHNKQLVLNDISFEVKKGEFFGIVGRNGSGKSTLLKLLAGIYSPDLGRVQVAGKLTPFIELGVGFSPELSGRENVYLNGALLGFNRKEMDALYDEIVDFAELREHMDKKLKNYSSGMQVRLAFSIAVKAKSDVLIFDEVLAVGDEAFQKKCMDIFRDYKKNKQTVILVTHSMENVRTLCGRALMLSDGNIEVVGSVDKVANAYLRSNEEALDVSSGSKPVSLSRIKLTGCKPVYKPQDNLNVSVEWPSVGGVSKVGVAIVGNDNEYIFGSNTGSTKVKGNTIDYSVNMNLGPGTYYLAVSISDVDGRAIEYADKIARFRVEDEHKSHVGGLTRFEYHYTQTK